MSLIKWLYLAERESLATRRRPVFGDDLRSMKDGPIVSTVYNLIKNDRAWLGFDPQYWPKHIETTGYDAVLRDPLDPHDLSESDLSILDRVYESYHAYDRWTLHDLLHKLPEYEETTSSIPILPEDLLRDLAGLTDQQIEEIRIETEGLRRMFADL